MSDELEYFLLPFASYPPIMPRRSSIYTLGLFCPIAHFLLVGGICMLSTLVTFFSASTSGHFSGGSTAFLLDLGALLGGLGCRLGDLKEFNKLEMILRVPVAIQRTLYFSLFLFFLVLRHSCSDVLLVTVDQPVLGCNRGLNVRRHWHRPANFTLATSERPSRGNVPTCSDLSVNLSYSLRPASWPGSVKLPALVPRHPPARPPAKS